MFSSIFFSALWSVSLLLLLNFLPFNFSENTRTIFVFISYISSSMVCEPRNENIFRFIRTEFDHLFLYSPLTFLSKDEIRTLVTSVSFLMGAYSLNSIFQSKKGKIFTRLQALFCFFVCYIVPVVKYLSREKLPMGSQMESITIIFCDVVEPLVVIDALVLLTGRKKQSDPCARSYFNDCAHVSPNPLSKLDGYCLQRIVQLITYFKDFVAFSEVCLSSRDVCSNMEWEGGPKPPCLVLSEKPGCSSRPFFSLHNRHVFVLDLPAAVGRYIWGSPHGWLATVGPELDAQLINPISQVCVNLPPFSTMLNQLAHGSRFHKVQKLFVFTTKIHPMKFLVIAILHPGHQLVFTRCPGDIGEWAFVSNPKEFFFRSVAYFEHQLYALCDNGSLIRIDFNGSIAARSEFVASHPIHEYVGYQPHHEKTGRAYLVPSQDDLFGVFRYSSKDIGFERTVQFFVYKFDFESLDWESVWSIEDKAFFVGNGNSWSINLAHTVNCNSNSIFYGDDMEGDFGLDNGIYDLETLQTEPLWFGANVPRSQPLATWITPSLTPSTFR